MAGYTDNTGSLAHNNKLSQQRAEAVMNYLISKGVPASMLTAKGYGPKFPIDTNATAAGRANNRRVVLKQTSKHRPQQMRRDRTIPARVVSTLEEPPCSRTSRSS